ncbi:hypothetical protein ACB092_12G169100 [Castanea dentata]
MPLSLAKEIFMKWTTWMIVSSLMMSPTMKMTTQSSTAMMSSVIGYCCCMHNYVIVIIEIVLDARMARKRQLGMVYAVDQEAHHSEEARPMGTPVQNPAPENTPARCSKTKLADIWAMTGDDYKIPLPLNAEGQPIDRAGSLFKRWLGSFCENGLLCPLTPARWPSVAEKHKRDCWVEIEKRYIIDPTIVAPPNQKAWAMHQLGEMRRNWRTKLKKKVLGTVPDEVIPVQWREMVEYWFDNKTETLSGKNAASRGKQEEIARSGAKSFAQISDEMAKAKRAPVECADVYQQVYRTKDGVAVSSRVQENMDRMAALLNEQGMRLEGEIGSGILWSRDDAYARVMDRPEHPGRVRGVGFGITLSGRSATNNSLFTSSPSSSTRTTQRISGLETSHEELREQLTQSEARHREDLAQSEARHREELAQSEARHKQQLDELRNSMREMFDKVNSLGPVIRELYSSQSGNA